MASSTMLAFQVVAVLLLQASWCAVAQHPGNAAVMALTSFEPGSGGSSPAACGDRYYSDDTLIVALSTDAYAGGFMCYKQIRITGPQPNGLNVVVAVVVDKSDTESGLIAASKRVWEELGLDTDLGQVDVTWVVVS